MKRGSGLVRVVSKRGEGGNQPGLYHSPLEKAKKKKRNQRTGLIVPRSLKDRKSFCRNAREMLVISAQLKAGTMMKKGGIISVAMTPKEDGIVRRG